MGRKKTLRYSAATNRTYEGEEKGLSAPRYVNFVEKFCTLKVDIKIAARL